MFHRSDILHDFNFKFLKLHLVTILSNFRVFRFPQARFFLANLIVESFFAVLFLPPTPSISPTHGDERAGGAYLSQDDQLEQQGLPVVTGLGNLLRGSDKWHITVVGNFE